MTLRAQLATDAITIFCNTDEFAESVVYYPVNGCPRPIDAVVLRETVTTFTDDDQNSLPTYQVHVANDVTSGIAGTELNLGGDSIGFPSKDGQKATKHTIHHIIDQDEGMLVLRCL